MNVLWAHDHTFYYNESGRFYSGGKLPYKVWERYLSVFGRLTVVGRGRKLSQDDPAEGKTLSSGPDVEFLMLPSLSNPVNRLIKKGYVDRMLTEAIGRADAVIARLPSELGAEAVRIAKRLGKPFAVEVVACAWDGLWNYGSLQGKLYAPIALRQTQAIVRRAPFALYVTESFLQQRYPCPNGQTGACSNVEIPEMSADVLDRRLERIRSEGWRPLVFGMIGSLNGNTKGIDTALKALARVRSSLPPFEFRVLGDGSAERWNKQVQALGLDDVVRFCGVLPSGGAVLDWLDDIDVYLQPSFQEGLPRATIEAMSRGCPVLGSTAGGIPELLDPHCLHKPGQDKRLASQIEKIVRDPLWKWGQAERNFHRAADYTKAKLDDSRYKFWSAFRQYAAERSESAAGVEFAREELAHEGRGMA